MSRVEGIISEHLEALRAFYSVAATDLENPSHLLHKDCLDVFNPFLKIAHVIAVAAIDRALCIEGHQPRAYNVNYYSAHSETERFDIEGQKTFVLDREHEGFGDSAAFFKSLACRKLHLSSKGLEGTLRELEGKLRHSMKILVDKDPLIDLLKVFYKLDRDYGAHATEHKLKKMFSMRAFFGERLTGEVAGRKGPYEFLREDFASRDGKYGTQQKFCNAFPIDKDTCNHGPYYQFLRFAFTPDLFDSRPEDSPPEFWGASKRTDALRAWTGHIEGKQLSQLSCAVYHPITGRELGNVIVYSICEDSPGSRGEERRANAVVQLVADRFLLLLSDFEKRVFALKQASDKYDAQLRSAITSVLVDSYSHNISAHSLAALKWRFQTRCDEQHLDQRIRFKKGSPLLALPLPGDPKDAPRIDPERLNTVAESAAAKFETLGLADARNDADHISLLDILQHMPSEELRSFLAFQAKTMRDTDKIGKTVEVDEILEFPLPVDHALMHFIQFLRDKATFWNSATRRQSFGAQSYSWYDILWNRFANNALYLGSIADSEGVTHVNIHLEIKKGGESSHGCFAVVGFPKETSDRAAVPFYSSQCMTRPGPEHQLLRKKLAELGEVSLPGGIVGLHALFSIFENTLRNVKHFRDIPEALKEMQIGGANLSILVEPLADGDKRPAMFRVRVCLGHKGMVLTENEPRWEELIRKLEVSVMDDDGMPRLGGSTQDKVCAAFLLRGSFLEVDAQHRQSRMQSKLAKRFANGEDNRFWIQPHIGHEPACLTGKTLARDFHVWKSAALHRVDENTTTGLASEYPGRFRLLYLHPTEQPAGESNLAGLERWAMREGLVRTLRPVDIKDDTLEEELNGFDTRDPGESQRLFEPAYSAWVSRFLSGRPSAFLTIHRPPENDRDYDPQMEGHLISPHLIDWSPSLSAHVSPVRLEYEEAIESLGEGSPVTVLHAQHGTTATLHDKQLRYRSHGILREQFFEEKGGLLELKDEADMTQLAEALLVKVCLFDNRIYRRICPGFGHDSDANTQETSENTCRFDSPLRTRLARQLQLNVYQESPLRFGRHETSLSTRFDFLVLHLGFIETLDGGEQFDLTKFIKHHLNIASDSKTVDALVPRFRLVITTGRGREDWLKELDGNYSRFTVYRPIEPLLSAVEDGISLEDDFQVKFNLCRVLFGS